MTDHYTFQLLAFTQAERKDHHSPNSMNNSFVVMRLNAELN
jgi:hypothetical protein